MCGIFGIFNILNSQNYEHFFMKGKSRGPDNSVFIKETNNITLGFHRLSINGIDAESNQPLKIDKITLICNGEIYNYKPLYQMLNIVPSTNSDCEVIIHMYQKYGIDHTLQLLDGVFAFILIDHEKNESYIARDPYGVRPLFKFQYDDCYIFSSEIKMIPTNMLNELTIFNSRKIQQFIPGHYMKMKTSTTLNTIEYMQKYTMTPFSFSMSNCDPNFSISNILQNINIYFTNAVKKRCMNTDREYCCLLSGGLDSSLVCAIASKYMNTKLKTFSIGLKDSVDIINARKVAKFLETDHHEIIVSEEDFFSVIPEVIINIESYDTTTVRASVGNYLVSKYIQENTDCKVVLNGDGADELAGGYLYFSECEDPIEFDKECKRLLNNISYFDVLRSDKSISSNGLEARTPFLDREFVQYYLSISPFMRCHRYNNTIEKHLIRMAFNDENILPHDILWRRKEAFSDGVSGNTKSWSEIIQDKVKTIDIVDNKHQYTHNVPLTEEQKYYRSIFENYYPNCGEVIPYFWMPKYIKATDSSARTLPTYNHVKENPVFNEYTKEEEPWDQLV